ncbi:putative TBC1 domain family member 22A [Blattamonas nauphoetae]|uniref:TBC1 domain family member 22A n=1 Tax=Blattamonas nauphoetae TaxID=2049346 RepID=A0ABQ9XM70_9EUKA|nr:putative TBC1 domain family member 22A [Blattamonas nauphoetae]
MAEFGRNTPSNRGGDEHSKINSQSQQGGNAGQHHQSEFRPASFLSEESIKKQKQLLTMPLIDLDALAELAWDGVNPPFRSVVWKLLLGYLPPLQSKQRVTVQKKRKQYWGYVDELITKCGVTDIWGGSQGGDNRGSDSDHSDNDSSDNSNDGSLGDAEFATLSVNLSAKGTPLAANGARLSHGDTSGVEEGMKQLTESNRQTLRQIRIDIPRTHCPTWLVEQGEFGSMMERILYVWAVRHPAAGYVQGINDLLVPFITTFAESYIESFLQMTHRHMPQDSQNLQHTATPSSNSMRGVKGAEEDDHEYKLGILPRTILRDIEADSYWCYSKFIDVIQDNYTFAQKGVQMQVRAVESIIQTRCPDLSLHLKKEGIEFLQFSFRWMNCVLVREFPRKLYARLLDAYFSKGTEYPALHVCVCAALLYRFKDDLLGSDFQDCLMTLQHLPTDKWTFNDMNSLLQRSYEFLSQRPNLS